MIIPKEVKFIIEKFKNHGFDAYIVGGCVRDFLRGVESEDWDVATNAKPKEIQKIFPKSFYKNRFLTVTVQTGNQSVARAGSDPTRAMIEEVEITTYRSEAKYTDKRHPDQIRFAKTIEEDLARRDFTVNAMAAALENGKWKAESGRKRPPATFHLPPSINIIDPFNGQKDLENKIIRAVKDPEERFGEDALRLMRAVRFAVTLGQGWEIEIQTKKAIKKTAGFLEFISKERIRDELMKIIMSQRATDGIELLRQLNLLKYIIPEIEEGYKISQNKHHIYDCYEHSLLSLKYAVQKSFNKYVRLAALLHDVGKPRVKKGEGSDATFYNHEILGTKMTIQILNRLKFPKKEIEKIARLVRHHLFYYNVGEVSEASVRRLVRQAGPENMEELLQVRMADRIGSGVPKAEPYKLRHLKYIIEKASHDPISVKMLKVAGDDIMEILNIKPGPKVGQILDILLGYVLSDPQKNKKEFLKKEIKKLGKITKNQLSSLTRQARKEREKLETKRDKMTKQKYWVT